MLQICQMEPISLYPFFFLFHFFLLSIFYFFIFWQLIAQCICIWRSYNISILRTKHNNILQYIIVITNYKIFFLTTAYVPDNSVKYNVKVESWPFANYKNSLQLVLQNDANTESSNKCKTVQSSNDGSQNLQWFKFNLGGLSLYPKKITILWIQKIKIQYYFLIWISMLHLQTWE